jgi:hypothetical protein
MTNDGLFEIALAVIVAQIEELQQVGIADGFLNGDSVFGACLPSFADHRFLVARSSGSFVELRADLTIELPYRPDALDRFVLVEPTGKVVPHGHQADVVRPGQGENIEQ